MCGEALAQLHGVAPLRMMSSRCPPLPAPGRRGDKGAQSAPADAARRARPCSPSASGTKPTRGGRRRCRRCRPRRHHHRCRPPRPRWPPRALEATLRRQSQHRVRPPPAVPQNSACPTMSSAARHSDMRRLEATTSIQQRRREPGPGGRSPRGRSPRGRARSERCPSSSEVDVAVYGRPSSELRPSRDHRATFARPLAISRGPRAALARPSRDPLATLARPRQTLARGTSRDLRATLARPSRNPLRLHTTSRDPRVASTRPSHNPLRSRATQILSNPVQCAEICRLSLSEQKRCLRPCSSRAVQQSTMVGDI